MGLRPAPVRCTPPIPLRFALVCAALVCLAPACKVGPPEGGQVQIGDFAIDVYEFPNERRASPAYNVSFPEAQASCERVGKRLCTLWEWQQACAGPDERRFPYGDSYDDSACHTAVSIQGHTSTGVAVGLARSGSYAGCVSDWGVYDLSGNLEEWVDGFHNGQRGILMGGAWYTYDEYTDCTGLYSQSPMYRMRPQEKVFSAGFRCCSGPPVSEDDLRAWEAEQRAAEIATTRDVSPEPADMVPVGDSLIDRFEYPNREGEPPRVHVTWSEAQRLCEGEGKRLCSADEWEAACRSPDGGDYPYGAVYRGDGCNTSSDGPAAAGSSPTCVSGVGAADMSGNVWEWTAERIDLGEAFGADHDRRVVRGGSWYDAASGTSCGYAMGYFAADPSFGYREVGFRCCKDKDAPTPEATGGDGPPGPGVVVLGEVTGGVAFELGGEAAPEAAPARPELVAGTGPASPVEVRTEREVQISRAGCPRDMLRAGGVCVDIFEYPNKAGEIPVANVTVEEADGLCRAQERRLCSAAEWMAACTGPSNTRWPYGDAYDRAACNYGYTGGKGGVVPSGSNKGCVSEYGLYDLSGNLWEWVSDVDAEGKAQIYGGYWNLGATYGKCNTVASAAQKFTHMSVGFRCCRDPIDDEPPG